MADIDVKTFTKRLENEIVNLREALIRTDKDSTQSVDNITENIRRTLDVLQEVVDKKIDITHSSFYDTPIHDLLSVGPLIRTEIPVVVLNKLIFAGFDTDCCDLFGRTCLDIAVEKHHYNIIRLLITHGARSNGGILRSVVPPVLSLASQPHVPLDLFDMLETQPNLYKCDGYLRFLSLHKAVSCRHTATALHLIKLGACVGQPNEQYSSLLVQYLIENDARQNEVFLNLLPSKATAILDIICRIIKEILLDTNNAGILDMFHQLVQRLHFDNPLKVECYFTFWSHDVFINMAVNDVQMTTVQQSNNNTSFPVVHLCSLLLVELQLDFSSTPRELPCGKLHDISADTKVLAYAQAINDVWKKYHQQSHVKSLVRLCILCTRNSMRSLDDESFLSLPVPSYLRRMLAYHDVSEELFEKVHQGLTTST